jgi:hypothetical protein
MTRYQATRTCIGKQFTIQTWWFSWPKTPWIKKEVNVVYEALAAIYPDWETQIPADSLKAGKAIVGVTSLALVPDSARSGQFQPDGEESPQQSRHQLSSSRLRTNPPRRPRSSK